MRASTGWLLAILVLACGGGDGSSAPEELETVDVGEALDAGVSVEADEKAVARGPEVAGVLPGGFPADLPLYKPSSVVDFGDAGAGRAYVELASPDSAGSVRQHLDAALKASGWYPGAGGAWAKGAREIRIEIAAAASSTRIRVEYRPGA